MACDWNRNFDSSLKYSKVLSAWEGHLKTVSDASEIFWHARSPIETEFIENLSRLKSIAFIDFFSLI
jgi:hypothetical protein